jgi:hypothetical protein
MEQTI